VRRLGFGLRGDGNINPDRVAVIQPRLLRHPEIIDGMGGTVDAYEVMREWDRVIGITPRSDKDLDADIPALLPNRDYEDWKTGLATGNVKAIKEGMLIWGLPIEPLGQFEADDAIQTVERPDLLD
jgi:hypothetical protein